MNWALWTVTTSDWSDRFSFTRAVSNLVRYGAICAPNIWLNRTNQNSLWMGSATHRRAILFEWRSFVAKLVRPLR
jgi:hypothetical protein